MIEPNREKHIFHINNVDCVSCELWIKKELSQLPGVQQIKINSNSNTIEVVTMESDSFDTSKFLEKANSILKQHHHDYGISSEDVHSTNVKSNIRPIVFILLVFTILFAAIYSLYFKGSGFEILNPSYTGAENTYIFMMILGIASSLSSCAVTTIILLLGALGNIQNSNINKQYLFIANFFVSRVIVFTSGGFILGLIGQNFNIKNNFWSEVAFSVLIILVSLMMGLGILGISREFTGIQNKRFGEKIFNLPGKVGSFLVPFSVALVSFLIPCGFAQSAQIFALREGNPLNSSLILSSFVLGTTPILLLLALGYDRFSKSKIKKYILLFSGLLMIWYSVDTLVELLKLFKLF